RVTLQKGYGTADSLCLLTLCVPCEQPDRLQQPLTCWTHARPPFLDRNPIAVKTNYSGSPTEFAGFLRNTDGLACGCGSNYYSNVPHRPSSRGWMTSPAPRRRRRIHRRLPSLWKLPAPVFRVILLFTLLVATGWWSYSKLEGIRHGYQGIQSVD